MAQVRQQEMGLILESDCVLIFGSKGDFSAVAVVSDFAENKKTVDRLANALFTRMLRIRTVEAESLTVGDYALHIAQRMMLDLYKADPTEQRTIKEVRLTDEGLKVDFEELEPAAAPTTEKPAKRKKTASK